MGKEKTYDVPVDICVFIKVSSSDPAAVTRKAFAAINHIAVDDSLAIGSEIKSIEFAGAPVETAA